jgi:hypothetical protein
MIILAFILFETFFEFAKIGSGLSAFGTVVDKV